MGRLRQNRRELVKGLAALGAVSLLPGPRSLEVRIQCRRERLEDVAQIQNLIYCQRSSPPKKGNSRGYQLSNDRFINEEDG
jgi:hypothetical protein